MFNMITKTELTLKEDVEKAVGLVAAEFSYAKALLEHVTKIEQEESDKSTKDIKKGFRLFRWIARGERNAHRTELKVIEDLQTWGETLPAESKKQEEKVIEQLKVVDGKLVKAASRFKGAIRQELLEIETEEQLIEKLKKKGFFDRRRIKIDLAVLFKNAKSDIEQLEQWLSAMEAILGEIISKIREGKKCVMAYRRNSFYDDIKRELELRFPGGIDAITVPVGTEKITSNEKDRITSLLNAAKDAKITIITDQTIKNLANWNSGNMYYTLERFFHELRSDEGVETFKNVLKEVAQRAKEKGVVNMVILIGGVSPKGVLYATLNEHGISIEVKDKEVSYYGRSEGYYIHVEIYIFLKQQFEKQGLNVYPALLVGEEISIGRSLKKASIYLSSVSQCLDGSPITLKPHETAIFADRHANIPPGLFTSVVFDKHELSTIEEKTLEGRSYLYTVALGKIKQLVDMIVVEIINQRYF